MKIGFIPLTDCASIVLASEMGFDKKYGIKITPSKEASWASVRDKLVNGELDASHVLWGLIYGVHLGIGGPKKDMATNGPAATIGDILEVKLLRPRNRLALAQDATYNHYRTEVLKFLYERQSKAAA